MFRTRVRLEAGCNSGDACSSSQEVEFLLVFWLCNLHWLKGLPQPKDFGWLVLGFFTTTDKLEKGCTQDPFFLERSTAQKTAPKPFYWALIPEALLLAKTHFSSCCSEYNFSSQWHQQVQYMLQPFLFLAPGHNLGLKSSPGFRLMLFPIVKPRVSCAFL